MKKRKRNNLIKDWGIMCLKILWKWQILSFDSLVSLALKLFASMNAYSHKCPQININTNVPLKLYIYKDKGIEIDISECTHIFSFPKLSEGSW